MNPDLENAQTTIYIATANGRAPGWGAVIEGGPENPIELFGCDGRHNSRNRLIWALIRSMAMTDPERRPELVVVTVSKAIVEVIGAVSNEKIQAALFGKMREAGGSEAFQHLLSITKTLGGRMSAKLIGSPTANNYSKRAEQLAEVAVLTGRTQWKDPHAIWRNEQRRFRRAAAKAANKVEREKRREWLRENTVVVTVTEQVGYKTLEYVDRRRRIPKDQLPAFEAQRRARIAHLSRNSGSPVRTSPNVDGETTARMEDDQFAEWIRKVEQSAEAKLPPVFCSHESEPKQTQPEIEASEDSEDIRDRLSDLTFASSSATG